MPNPRALLSAVNALLEQYALPRCNSLVTGSCDQDTANPTVIGEAAELRYVVKCVFRYRTALRRQVVLANALRAATGLAIPAHYCCAEADATLPIVVMEWMPGESLRTHLTATNSTLAADFAADYGRSQARFHCARTKAIDKLLAHEPVHGDRHRDAALSLIQQSPDHIAIEDRKRIAHFLEVRMPALDSPLAAGLVKVDDDLRDYLGLASPEPHISGMLDWEYVWSGDSAHAVAMVFHRFRISGLDLLWPSFRAGYESASGCKLVYGPQIEIYLMWRAVHAAGVTAGSPNRRARELIAALLNGHDLGYVA